MKDKLIYLGSPLRHPEPEVIQERFNLNAKAVAYLMKKGLNVFSPVVHSTCIVKTGLVQWGWETWEAPDIAILNRCDLLMVLKLEGWQGSQGLLKEMGNAQNMGIPIFYMDYEHLVLWSYLPLEEDKDAELVLIKDLMKMRQLKTYCGDWNQ